MFYFAFEVVFHGFWDLYLAKFYGGVPFSFRIHIAHEMVDFIAVFMILLICSLNQRI